MEKRFLKKLFIRKLKIDIPYPIRCCEWDFFSFITQGHKSDLFLYQNENSLTFAL